MVHVDDPDSLPTVEFDPLADVISHVPCPECGERGNTGLVDTNQFKVVQCRSCDTLFQKDDSPVEDIL